MQQMKFNIYRSSIINRLSSSHYSIHGYFDRESSSKKYIFIYSHNQAKA